MKNIVLTGFMASGKTVIGQALAALTGRLFVDTDALIEAEAGLTANEIFAQYGEAYFRDLETAAVRQAAQLEHAVIATGGGAVLRAENLELLRRTGIIVNLAPAEETILARLSQAAGTRPLLQGQDAMQVLARFRAREPFYSNCDYKLCVTNEKSPRGYAREILEMLDFLHEIK